MPPDVSKLVTPRSGLEASEKAKDNSWFRRLRRGAGEQFDSQVAPGEETTPPGGGFNPVPPQSGTGEENISDRMVIDDGGSTPPSGGFDPVPPRTGSSAEDISDRMVIDDADRTPVTVPPTPTGRPSDPMPLPPGMLSRRTTRIAAVTGTAVLAGAGIATWLLLGTTPNPGVGSNTPPVTVAPGTGATNPGLNTILYAAAVQPSAKCTNLKRCTDFLFRFTNTSTATVDGIMLGSDGDPFKNFGLNGAPACHAVGEKFGIKFQNDWQCLGVKILPQTAITGYGTAKNPLTPATTFRIDSSPNASSSGFGIDNSQVFHFVPVPVTPG